MNLILLSLVILIKLFFVSTLDLDEYLDEKLRQSKIEFIKIHIQEISPVQEKSYRVQWDISWRVPLIAEHRPSTIHMFDGIFILDGNRVMAPSFNDTSLNETSSLRQDDQIEEYPAVKFVRNIIWKNSIIYLLTCYENGLCSLHTGTQNETLRFRQTIGYRGIPSDAKFFTQGDRVYLIVANNAEKFSMPSMIYRWSGTYMDVVSDVMTIGAISVTTFEYKQSTIIVFAQRDGENPRINSEVYEFKGNNIVRIQFLPTNKPISVHHYVHGDFNFILMINELEPSNVLCWDGRELLDWFTLPEIEPHSLISTFHMDANTFVIVAHDNIIQLYKFHSTSDWKSENVKYFNDSQKIVDMAVLMKNCTMTVVLIIMEENVYWVEQWEVEIASLSNESVIRDTDSTRKCLSDLIETLQMRMTAIKEAEASWEYLLPSTKNLTILEPIKLDNLILEAGTVQQIDMVTEEEEEILPPHQIQESLNKLDSNINDILSEWQGIVNTTVSEILKGNIIADDAFLDELQIDKMHVDFLNDEDVRPEDIIFPEDEEEFVNSLRAKRIVARNLEVDSLCGIPSQYWKLQNNATNIFAFKNDLMEYSNGTIIVHSDVTVSKLNIKNLNGTVINQLIDDLFVINSTNKITGKIRYKNSLRVTNLTTQMLNGIPADKLMTRATNQSFDDFYVKNLNIENLHAETIKGIRVDEAARKSRINVIKGELKLAKLHVTENLTIDVNSSLVVLPKDKPLQIYENVTILGDLHLKNIEIKNTATLFMEDVQLNIRDMFNVFWTKSTNQTITREINFESGLTIDELNTKYLNGFTKNDFLYTTVQEISKEFTNLHFEHFHVNGSFFKDGYNTTFFEVSPKLLTIRKNLHVQNLQANDIITLSFNGISLESIMNGSQANFSGALKLPSIRAQRVFVDNLDVHYLNNRSVHFDKRIFINDNHKIDTLKLPEFYAQSLEIEKLNDIEMSVLLQLKNLKSSDLNDIVIDGDLIVEHLKVKQIDGQPSENFLKELAETDIQITPEKKIENLIVENLTLQFIHGQNFNNLISNVLSKSKEQVVSGHFSAHEIISNNITINFINTHNVSQLMWIDEPLTIIGNVTFSDLFVDGDIITSNLNGHDLHKLYDDLLVISAKNIDVLKVNGNVSWDISSSNSNSISYLFENAVTKDLDQVITGKVTFDKDIHAWTVNSTLKEVDEIQDIISDVIIDCEKIIKISGKKIFENDFVTDVLTVNGNVDILKINHINILEFNDSVVRKEFENTKIGPLIFLKEVKIEKLYTSDIALNASLSSAVRSTDILPHNIFFEKLVVLDDVYLKNFDGLYFDKFINNRVTLSGSHNISSDIKFNGLITITDNADVKKINGIYPSDFVLNEVDEVQVISDSKSFEKDLIVEGNITTLRINNIDMLNEYVDSVQNDEDVDIFGDLIFKANVQIREMNISGLVNGVNLRSIVDDLRENTNVTLQSLKQQENIIKQDMSHSFQLSETLHNIFFYLETEENLKIRAPNISKIDVMYVEKMTRLNMYGEQYGELCGLPSNNCSCLYQYIAELSDDNVRIWRKNSSGIVRNFHDSNNIFGINLEVNTVSSSRECTSTRIKQEFTKISFMTLDIKNSGEIMPLITNVPDAIEGYLKDAKIFKHNDDIYIVLAIYYNKTRATHHANSLLYKVDLITRNVILIQEIPTNGAWSIETFKINSEIFLLIGCFGTSSQSLLYKFDSRTSKFEQLRSFVSNSRYVKSLSQGRDHFVLLDNPDTNAVNIFKYNFTSSNFDNYQNIYHNHQINGIECFYADDFGDSDAFIIVTTQGGHFYIYEYMFAEKFQIKLQSVVNDLQTMVPFRYMNKQYIIAGTHNDSKIFRIIQQGPR